MKTKLFYVVAAVCAVTLSACGAKKQVVSQPSASPFGEVYEMPCAVYDTPEKFAATGIYRGSYKQKGELHKWALQNAKQIIWDKYQHVYKGMISDYSNTFGNNQGNDVATKVERAGDVVINAALNDAYEVCTRYSNVFDDGHMECYVAIEIEKGEIANQVAKRVADVLTEEEKERLNFNEYNFRQQMEERMRNYNANK